MTGRLGRSVNIASLFHRSSTPAINVGKLTQNNPLDILIINYAKLKANKLSCLDKCHKFDKNSNLATVHAKQGKYDIISTINKLD